MDKTKFINKGIKPKLAHTAVIATPISLHLWRGERLQQRLVTEVYFVHGLEDNRWLTHDYETLLYLAG